MLGGEVREFLIELESRFPDFHLSSSGNEWLNSLEFERKHTEIAFPQIVSILNSLASPDSTFPASQPGHFSGETEKMYMSRISELENDLAKRRSECEELVQHMSQLEVDLSRANHHISDVINGLRFSDIFSCNG
ncbi:hypothetical protein PSACC_03022 [Paramicrosporidium saccamoebae]|uniref:Uncharacterized protein n=1 Tax=Paramicrosporidium saccamoebae TaxID=1246581 RepID=A0A2H9THE3_9FUNG|nr:hypothetical protein PSACC_03022 [Paramicrosporidium saccamoebae]